MPRSRPAADFPNRFRSDGLRVNDGDWPPPWRRQNNGVVHTEQLIYRRQEVDNTDRAIDNLAPGGVGASDDHSAWYSPPKRSQKIDI
jgi:hypothetical protein